MVKIFLEILNLSIQGSLLILVAALIRILLRKAPKWFHCLLWGLVAVRLICPFHMESAMSLAPNAEIFSMDEQDSRLTVQSGIPFIDGTVNSDEQEASVLPVTTTEQEAGNQPVYPVTLIWLGGIAILSAYAVGSYLRIHRRVNMSIRIRQNIYMCDRITTPFILGIIRPHIYVPSCMGEEQMESVILHERAHLKRGDHFWKPLAFGVLIIHWFNPFCWLAYRLFCRDIEMACDEKVIRYMNLEQKKQYSRDLLSFSQQGSLISACPLAFGEVGVKQRIKLILNYRKPSFWVMIVAVVLIIVTSVLFLTSPEKTSPEETKTEEAGKNGEISSEGKEPENMETGMTGGIPGDGQEPENIEAGQTGDVPGDSHMGSENMEAGQEAAVQTIKVSVPKIDRTAITGADGSSIYYADIHKFIFGGYYGLFVYDMEQKKVVRGVDLRAIGCDATQGDSACEIQVTEDGSLVFLHPMNQSQMFVYHVGDNVITKENYDLDGYNLYQNQYTGKLQGKYASYEADGDIHYVVLVNDMTIGELGYVADERMSSYQLIFSEDSETREVP